MTSHQLTSVLFGLAVVVVVARMAGGVARRVGQPAVVGEILAGILMGPTVLNGAIAGWVMPPDVRPLFGVLSNVGLAVFVFLIGYELDRDLLLGRGRVAAGVSLASVTVPFGLGVLLASHLAATRPAPERAGFVLFFGVVVAVTAFPVLARIIDERGLNRTRVGGVAMGAAAIDDLLAWTMLAVVVAVVHPGAESWRPLLFLPYLLLVAYPVRHRLRRLVAARARAGQMTVGTLAVVLAGLLLSSGITEWLGLHMIFGAFAFGVAMPAGGGLREEIMERLRPVTEVLLLPVLFIMLGINVDISGVAGPDVALLALIIAIAVVGKAGGAFVAGWVGGLSLRDATTLGVLMNTRGLTPLIVLEVGRELGLLDPVLHSLMVLMAVATTMMTGPLLRLLAPPPGTWTASGRGGRVRVASGRPWWAGG